MTKYPTFLLEKPEPVVELRQYHGRKIKVYKGKVNISKIQGWVDNPRIELAKKQFLSETGVQNITQEQIFDIMKNDRDIRLKELRADILENGLREPLTLSFNKKLLDGNRRFFALLYALKSLSPTDPNRQDLENVNVFVLTEDSTESDEQNVLVEENFSPSLKIEWPDYVKAQKVVEADEDGFSVEDIAEKYGWGKQKIRDTLKINTLIREFITYATAPENPIDEDFEGLGITEHEAEMVAAKNYQFFNEAKKSFLKPLNEDFEFKIQFFKWIYENKFSSFQEVRIAYKAWQEPQAKAALLRDEAGAAKDAKTIVEYNLRVAKSADETIGRIDNFLTFLKKMSAEEIKLIPEESREKLKEVTELITKMSKAASE